MFSHLSYSPDLAPNKYHLFSAMKIWLDDNVEQWKGVTIWLKSQAIGFITWWKRLIILIWTFATYNLYLFAAWLLILSTYRWPVLSTASDQLLVIVRSIALTDLGNNLRNDCILLFTHPLFFLATFLLFVFMTKCYISGSNVEREGEERAWWEVLSLDCLFRRPMASLSRPLPPSEIQLEEGIELLIERLAVPHLWLQPTVLGGDYIKDLPIWRYQSPTEDDRVRRKIVELMDGDNSRDDSSSEEREEDLVDCPVKGMLPTTSCAVCLETYQDNSVLCGLPCGHNYHKRCIHMWLHTDNHHCPICRWPVYKNNHPRFQQ
ncbi:hypothetical protein J6590_063821 [Homalodisca vitripennis]|nr:hypothetical protein J6590_063821 [Homalodisca vitripennis]